jgi:hypothetical protein
MYEYVMDIMASDSSFASVNVKDFKFTRCDRNILVNWDIVYNWLGRAAAQWLKHCATNWKVTGSRPSEVNEFLYFT